MRLQEINLRHPYRSLDEMQKTDAFDPRVAPAVAAAVARVAMETGIARIKVDPEEVRANTMKRVGR